MKIQSIGLVILLVTLPIGIVAHHYLKQVNFRVISAQLQKNSTLPSPSNLASSNPKIYQQEKITFPIDINRASFEELVALPKIGPTLAQRILNYRNKSGKFSCKKDLLQIKGISENTLKKFAHLIYITNSTQTKIITHQDKVKDKVKLYQDKIKPSNNDQLQLIDINKATVAQLVRLPGIGTVKATAIVEWRNIHGTFTNIHQLLNVKGIGQKTLTKILPYITIENYSTSTTETDQYLLK